MTSHLEAGYITVCGLEWVPPDQGSPGPPSRPRAHGE